MFDITPYLNESDPWVAADGVDFIKKLYDEKFRLASLLRPRSIVEIGVRAAYTAAAFLAACPGASYQGFDNCSNTHGGWKDISLWAEKNLKDKFPNRDINVKILDTQKTHCLPCGPVDLAIVDGDHSYNGAMHDLGLCVRLNPRWILLDDVTFDENVRMAAKDFLTRKPWRGVLFPTVRGDLLLERNAW